MVDKKPFKWEYHPRIEFAKWIRQEFPELRRYQFSEENYADLEERIHEVHEAAMLVLNFTMEKSDFPIRNYYSEDLEHLKGDYQAKDFKAYAKHLDAFADAIDVE